MSLLSFLFKNTGRRVIPVIKKVPAYIVLKGCRSIWYVQRLSKEIVFYIFRVARKENPVKFPQEESFMYQIFI
jgi:hypothetical protein